MTSIRIKRERVRKPSAPRTCCETHRDTCNFGGWHLWVFPFYDEDGTWNDSGAMKCSTCGGICTGDVTR